MKQVKSSIIINRAFLLLLLFTINFVLWNTVTSAETTFSDTNLSESESIVEKKKPVIIVDDMYRIDNKVKVNTLQGVLHGEVVYLDEDGDRQKIQDEAAKIELIYENEIILSQKIAEDGTWMLDFMDVDDLDSLAEKEFKNSSFYIKITDSNEEESELMEVEVVTTSTNQNFSVYQKEFKGNPDIPEEILKDPSRFGQTGGKYTVDYPTLYPDETTEWNSIIEVRNPAEFSSALQSSVKNTKVKLMNNIKFDYIISTHINLENLEIDLNNKELDAGSKGQIRVHRNTNSFAMKNGKILGGDSGKGVLTWDKPSGFIYQYVDTRGTTLEKATQFIFTDLEHMNRPREANQWIVPITSGFLKALGGDVFIYGDVKLTNGRYNFRVGNLTVWGNLDAQSTISDTVDPGFDGDGEGTQNISFAGQQKHVGRKIVNQFNGDRRMYIGKDATVKLKNPSIGVDGTLMMDVYSGVTNNISNFSTLTVDGTLYAEALKPPLRSQAAELTGNASEYSHDTGTHNAMVNVNFNEGSKVDLKSTTTKKDRIGPLQYYRLGVFYTYSSNINIYRPEHFDMLYIASKNGVGRNNMMYSYKFSGIGGINHKPYSNFRVWDSTISSWTPSKEGKGEADYTAPFVNEYFLDNFGTDWEVTSNNESAKSRLNDNTDLENTQLSRTINAKLKFDNASRWRIVSDRPKVIPNEKFGKQAPYEIVANEELFYGTAKYNPSNKPVIGGKVEVLQDGFVKANAKTNTSGDWTLNLSRASLDYNKPAILRLTDDKGVEDSVALKILPPIKKIPKIIPNYRFGSYEPYKVQTNEANFYGVAAYTENGQPIKKGRMELIQGSSVKVSGTTDDSGNWSLDLRGKSINSVQEGLLRVTDTENNMSSVRVIFQEPEPVKMTPKLTPSSSFGTTEPYSVSTVETNFNGTAKYLETGAAVVNAQVELIQEGQVKVTGQTSQTGVWKLDLTNKGIDSKKEGILKLTDRQNRTDLVKVNFTEKEPEKITPKIIPDKSFGDKEPYTVSIGESDFSGITKYLESNVGIVDGTVDLIQGGQTKVSVQTNYIGAWTMNLNGKGINTSQEGTLRITDNEKRTDAVKIKFTEKEPDKLTPLLVPESKFGLNEPYVVYENELNFAGIAKYEETNIGIAGGTVDLVQDGEVKLSTQTTYSGIWTLDLSDTSIDVNKEGVLKLKDRENRISSVRVTFKKRTIDKLTPMIKPDSLFGMSDPYIVSINEKAFSGSTKYIETDAPITKGTVALEQEGRLVISTPVTSTGKWKLDLSKVYVDPEVVSNLTITDENGRIGSVRVIYEERDWRTWTQELIPDKQYGEKDPYLVSVDDTDFHGIARYIETENWGGSYLFILQSGNEYSVGESDSRTGKWSIDLSNYNLDPNKSATLRSMDFGNGNAVDIQIRFKEGLNPKVIPNKKFGDVEPYKVSVSESDFHGEARYQKNNAPVVGGEVRLYQGDTVLVRDKVDQEGKWSLAFSGIPIDKNKIAQLVLEDPNGVTDSVEVNFKEMGTEELTPVITPHTVFGTSEPYMVSVTESRFRGTATYKENQKPIVDGELILLQEDRVALSTRTDKTGNWTMNLYNTNLLNPNQNALLKIIDKNGNSSSIEIKFKETSKPKIIPDKKFGVSVPYIVSSKETNFFGTARDLSTDKNLTVGSVIIEQNGKVLNSTSVNNRGEWSINLSKINELNKNQQADLILRDLYGNVDSTKITFKDRDPNNLTILIEPDISHGIVEPYRGNVTGYATGKATYLETGGFLDEGKWYFVQNSKVVDEGVLGSDGKFRLNFYSMKNLVQNQDGELIVYDRFGRNSRVWFTFQSTVPQKLTPLIIPEHKFGSIEPYEVYNSETNFSGTTAYLENNKPVAYSKLELIQEGKTKITTKILESGQWSMDLTKVTLIPNKEAYLKITDNYGNTRQTKLKIKTNDTKMQLVPDIKFGKAPYRVSYKEENFHGIAKYESSGNPVKHGRVGFYKRREGTTLTTTTNEKGEWSFTGDNALAKGNFDTDYPYIMKLEDNYGNIVEEHIFVYEDYAELYKIVPDQRFRNGDFYDVSKNEQHFGGTIEPIVFPSPTKPEFTGNMLLLYQNHDLNGFTMTDQDGNWTFSFTNMDTNALGRLKLKQSGIKAAESDYPIRFLDTDPEPLEVELIPDRKFGEHAPYKASISEENFHGIARYKKSGTPIRNADVSILSNKGSTEVLTIKTNQKGEWFFTGSNSIGSVINTGGAYYYLKLKDGNGNESLEPLYLFEDNWDKYKINVDESFKKGDFYEVEVDEKFFNGSVHNITKNEPGYPLNMTIEQESNNIPVSNGHTETDGSFTLKIRDNVDINKPGRLIARHTRTMEYFEADYPVKFVEAVSKNDPIIIPDARFGVDTLYRVPLDELNFNGVAKYEKSGAPVKNGKIEIINSNGVIITAYSDLQGKWEFTGTNSIAENFKNGKITESDLHILRLTDENGNQVVKNIFLYSKDKPQVKVVPDKRFKNGNFYDVRIDEKNFNGNLEVISGDPVLDYGALFIYQDFRWSGRVANLEKGGYWHFDMNEGDNIDLSKLGRLEGYGSGQLFYMEADYPIRFVKPGPPQPRLYPDEKFYEGNKVRVSLDETQFKGEARYQYNETKVLNHEVELLQNGVVVGQSNTKLTGQWGFDIKDIHDRKKLDLTKKTQIRIKEKTTGLEDYVDVELYQPQIPIPKIIPNETFKKGDFYEVDNDNTAFYGTSNFVDKWTNRKYQNYSDDLGLFKVGLPVMGGQVEFIHENKSKLTIQTDNNGLWSFQDNNTIKNLRLDASKEAIVKLTEPTPGNLTDSVKVKINDKLPPTGEVKINMYETGTGGLPNNLLEPLSYMKDYRDETSAKHTLKGSFLDSETEVKNKLEEAQKKPGVTEVVVGIKDEAGNPGWFEAPVLFHTPNKKPTTDFVTGKDFVIEYDDWVGKSEDIRRNIMLDQKYGDVKGYEIDDVNQTINDITTDKNKLTFDYGNVSDWEPNIKYPIIISSGNYKEEVNVTLVKSKVKMKVNQVYSEDNTKAIYGDLDNELPIHNKQTFELLPGSELDDVLSQLNASNDIKIINDGYDQIYIKPSNYKVLVGSKKREVVTEKVPNDDFELFIEYKGGIELDSVPKVDFGEITLSAEEQTIHHPMIVSNKDVKIINTALSKKWKLNLGLGIKGIYNTNNEEEFLGDLVFINRETAMEYPITKNSTNIINQEDGTDRIVSSVDVLTIVESEGLKLKQSLGNATGSYKGELLWSLEDTPKSNSAEINLMKNKSK